MANIKELSKLPERLGPGHRLCAGCGASIGIRQVLMGAGDNSLVVGCATGCLEVATTIYPFTAWNVPFIHNAFENSAATMSGVETAYRALKKQGKITKEIKFLAMGGDGGTYDIGFQSLSGALERGHKMVYVCLPPDTELLLKDGTSVSIGEFVSPFISDKAEKRILVSSPYAPDLLSSQIRHDDFQSVKAKGSVLTWENGRSRFADILKVQRKKSPKYLVEIITSSGSKLRLTPEHPVLIDMPDGPQYLESEKLKPGDEVYSLRKVDLYAPNKLYVFDYLDSDIPVLISSGLKESIRYKLSRKYGTVKEACEQLGIKYWQLKEKKRPVAVGYLRTLLDVLGLDKKALIKSNISYSNHAHYGGLDKKVSPDIMYLLGLISSDGYVGTKRYGMSFVNKNAHLLKVFKRIYKKELSLSAVTQTTLDDGVTYLHVCSPVLYSLAKSLNIKSDPKVVAFSSEELVASFLRGYFDGDGCCSIVNDKGYLKPRIILTTTVSLLAKRLNFMLKRLGIAAALYTRNTRYDVIISSSADIKRFIEVVGSNHIDKQKKMTETLALLNSRKSHGLYFSTAPRVCARIIKQVCLKHNIPITKIDKKRNICTSIAGKRRFSKAKAKEYLERLKELVVDDPLFEDLQTLTREDFYLDPIKKINVIPSVHEYVYDITVDKTHNFIPEAAFVISNCYTNEAYMNTSIQRSGATPFGASTTTSPAGKVSFGKAQFRKDLTAIVAAHNIPYAAQATISNWNDLVTKSEKAFAADGPAFINILALCHRGWRYKQEDAVSIAKLAVETCYWPLYEVVNGKQWKVTYKPKEKKPIVEWLESQGRFKHLLKPGNEELIKKIQEHVDTEWEYLLKRSES